VNIDDCIKEGFLKKVGTDIGLASKEINESRKDLEDARGSLDAGKLKWSIIQSYYSMFHAARAVLFSIGLKERKHFAVQVVLEDLVKKRELEQSYVEDFKAGMFTREEADYESEYSREKAAGLLEVAEGFYKRMKALLKAKA
jgi:uncharacterized protein (UPF0332 family)